MGTVDDSDGTAGAEPTHQNASTREALISGTLNGTLDCLWLDVQEGRVALVLPEGSSTEVADEGILLIAADGTEVARTGNEVNITGGFDPAEVPCSDANAIGYTFVVGRIERSQ